MLQNAYFLAKIGAVTAENEQHFAEILPKTGTAPSPPPVVVRRTAPHPIDTRAAGAHAVRASEGAEAVDHLHRRGSARAPHAPVTRS